EFAHFLRRKVFCLPPPPVRGAGEARPAQIHPLRFVVVESAPRARAQSAQLRRLGQQPIRQTSLQYFLQELYREGLGNELPRNLGRLGRATDQGFVIRQRDPQRAFSATPSERQLESDQDVDQFLQAPAARAGNDVGDVRVQNQGTGRRARNGLPRYPVPIR